jgi:hypothetical protein
VFIAEVERFNVLINQAFESTHGGVTIRGRAIDFGAFMKGHKHLNDDVKDEGFMSKMYKKAKAAVAKVSEIPEKDDLHDDDKSKNASPFETAYAQDDGDVMSVADILRMADTRGAALLDAPRSSKDERGESLRTEGAVIQMHITYDNKKAFDMLGKNNATYTITASYLPMKYYRVTYDTLMNDGQERLVNDVYGLLILMTVTGHIRTFSISYMLTYLTTAMVSLALATTLTDYIMQYAFEQSPRFTLLKFQQSMLFGKFNLAFAAVKDKYKEKYDPNTNKAVATADVLNNKAEAAIKKGDISFTPEDLLATLLKLDQRLNRLDAVDDVNGVDDDGKFGMEPDNKRDKGSVWLEDWEDKYNKEQFGADTADPGRKGME